MPTGTKIAVIVLVVLLGAAGLYYAFVPPAPTPKSDSLKSSSTGTTSTLGSATGTGSMGTVPNSTGTLGAPSTLPPAGTGASASGLSPNGGTTSGSPTTDGLEALANRQRQLSGSGTNPATGTLAGNTNGLGTNPGANPASNPGTGVNPTTTTTTGTATTPSNGTTDGGQTGAPAGAVTSRGFNNGFKSSTTGQNSSGAGLGSPTTPGSGSNATTTTPSNPAGSNTSTPAGNTTVATGGEQTHVVKKGETMESIAKTYYGSGAKWQVIAKANPQVEPQSMRIGAKLRIPAAGAAVGAETTVASRGSAGSTGSNSSSNATASTSGGNHVVAKGETLSSIARRYYGDAKYWKSILKANPKVNADSLAVGTKLVIPSKTTVVSGGNVERKTDQ